MVEIWNECLALYGGPYLFGAQRTMADAMYAPVATRFLTYGVPLDAVCAGYCATIMAMPEMQEWVAAAKLEPEDIDELEMETTKKKEVIALLEESRAIEEIFVDDDVIEVLVDEVA